MKPHGLVDAEGGVGSLPTRERELKQAGGANVVFGEPSLPTRERELKHELRLDALGLVGRSLHGSVN